MKTSESPCDLLCNPMSPEDMCPRRYVVLVSGLNLGSPWCDRVNIEMFVDYVTGQLGAYRVRGRGCLRGDRREGLGGVD